jgi:uncharacterized membrane protein
MNAIIKVTEVPAARGLAWIGESFRLFRRAPLEWIGLCAGWLVITLGLFFAVPLIGPFLANFLQPVFFASFAIAACKQARDEKITMADLFTGFRRNWRALVNVGALLLLAQFLIFLVMTLLGLSVNAPTDRDMTVAEYVQMFEGKEWILAAGFLLTAVVKGALWFAPPLIAFHGMSTMHAIRWSVYAALANIGAMMVYGSVLLFLFFLGLIPWALGLLVVIPLMAISSYVGYRDVFETRPKNEGQTPV